MDALAPDASEVDEKVWPFHGYAPGNYLCKCARCTKTFEGDKRCIICLECAIKSVASKQTEIAFTDMLKSMELDGIFSQKDIATALGISPQYFSDLMRGRRKPSVSFVNRVCEYKGCGPLGRAAWHKAAARDCGWEIGA